MSDRELRVIDVFVDDDDDDGHASGNGSGGVRYQERLRIVDRPQVLATIAAMRGAAAVLVWDAALDLPPTGVVADLLRGPCHVWHAGLLLGQHGRPGEWAFCHGRAMFSRDVDPGIESTSWRVSSSAVLVRAEVLEELGGFDPGFDTASGAALDAGLRWITHGALVRHVPALVAPGARPAPDRAPSTADGIRIVRRRLGTKWAVWSVVRGLRTRSMRPTGAVAALRTIREALPPRPATFGLSSTVGIADPGARVTVLVPTVGRYDYLEKLLVQLAAQSRLPDEVVVVDQNPEDERRDLTTVAPGLAVRVLHLLPPGQCTARNLGLAASTGSHILFLDDDDEVPSDLVERHLEVLADDAVAISCGLVDDAESGPAPAAQRFRRAGDTFPTNNAMIRRTVLEATGLFDPTFDRGARADHDLGMRSYLNGNLHVYDPGPQVFHHHAPMGGLRTHGARIRTRGNSRSSIAHRHLRTATDLYLGHRYYDEQQVHEDLVLSVFATLFGGGTAPNRAARLLVQLALLPDSWRRSKEADREGRRLLLDRPAIPALRDES